MKRYSHKAMDTVFTVIIGKGEDEATAASAANAAFNRIDAIETLLTRFSDTSDVAVIRALKPGDVAVVAPETINVIVSSVKVAMATKGAFDISLGRGLNRLVVDTQNLRVSVKSVPGVDDEPLSLDFGGIGKGFSLDECAKVLKDENYGLGNWLIDAGNSTVLASGVGDDGSPWKLGVGGEWRERAKLDALSLDNAALSGSGPEVKGNHIVDARSVGSSLKWAHSWVRAESAAVADALSTAVMSMTGGEIAAACEQLNAGVMVSRAQSAWKDRFRSPVVTYGRFW